MYKKMFPFKYSIVKRKRKTIEIKINNQGEVIITSPFGISTEIIDSILKKRENWILEKIKIVNNEILYRKTMLDEGYKILYLGKQYEIEVNYESKNNNFCICNEKLNISLFIKEHMAVGKEEVIKNYIVDMYKKEAHKILIERTKVYSDIIGKKPNKITIKNQHTIWGSCSSKRNINYNYKIIMAPMEVIDYLVVHELCHLIYMNHSKQYWNMVRKVMPDYKIREHWLKENGLKLMKALE